MHRIHRRHRFVETERLSVNNTLKCKAVFVVHHVCIANVDKSHFCRIIVLYTHVVFKEIVARANFLSDLLTLPSVPVRNVAEALVCVDTVQSAECIHLPLCTTMLAPQMYALAFCFKLCATRRAFVQNAIKTVCTFFAFCVIAFFNLPFVFVLFKGFFYPCLYFVCRKCFYLVLSTQHVKMSLLSYATIWVFAPLWRVDKVAVRLAHNHRHACTFAKLAECTVKTFVYAGKLKPCLRIDCYRVFLLFEVS